VCASVVDLVLQPLSVFLIRWVADEPVVNSHFCVYFKLFTCALDKEFMLLTLILKLEGLCDPFCCVSVN
jgi:hypothetical protein